MQPSPKKKYAWEPPKNDAWRNPGPTVRFKRFEQLPSNPLPENFNTQNKENYLMDSFLNGFRDMLEKCKESEDSDELDVSKEMNDLLKIYTDAEASLLERENNALNIHCHYAKIYLDMREERRELGDKIRNLKAKMPKEEECI